MCLREYHRDSVTCLLQILLAEFPNTGCCIATRTQLRSQGGFCGACADMALSSPASRWDSVRRVLSFARKDRPWWRILRNIQFGRSLKETCSTGVGAILCPLGLYLCVESHSFFCLACSARVRLALWPRSCNTRTKSSQILLAAALSFMWRRMPSSLPLSISQWSEIPFHRACCT